MLWCGLKLPTRCVGSEVSWEVEAKVSCCLCPAEGHWCELQRDLQMVATGAGLGEAWDRLSCKLRLPATNVELGAV